MGKKGTKETLADETNKLVHQIDQSGVDAIIAGWPCQDASVARGDQATGIEGERTGLWTRLFRTIRLVRPNIALLENVAALLNRGIGKVFGDLAGIGYDCQWHCIQAKAVGLPHVRKRLYTVAYPSGLVLKRMFPRQIQGEPEISWWADCRSTEELPKRSNLYPSQLCGSNDGVAKRLHGIGNGNPPAIIRQLMQHIKAQLELKAYK